MFRGRSPSFFESADLVPAAHPTHPHPTVRVPLSGARWLRWGRLFPKRRRGGEPRAPLYTSQFLWPGAAGRGGAGRGGEIRASGPTLRGFEGRQIGGGQPDGLNTKERPRRAGQGKGPGQRLQKRLWVLAAVSEECRVRPTLPWPSPAGKAVVRTSAPLKESPYPYPYPRWAQDKDTALAMSQGHRGTKPPTGLVVQVCQRCPPSLSSCYFLMLAFLRTQGSSWAEEFPLWL